MTISIQRLNPSTLELRVSGRLDADDYRKVLPMIEDAIREHGQIGLVVRIPGMRGWSASGLWEDLKFDVRHYRDVARVALVTGGERKGWMAAVSRPFTGGQVRAFSMTELEAARRWAASGDAAATEAEHLILQSPAFEPGQELPTVHARDGGDLSPPLRWSGAPLGTRSFAMIMVDPDAPSRPFTHWIAYNIPVTDEGLPAGVQHRGDLSDGILQGRNGFDEYGYCGPRPPGGKDHRYTFNLYALDDRLALPPGADRDEVESAMRGHILAATQLTTHYTRPAPDSAA
ncbi:MAG: YbhB/YbcL family Raf kinase inhibitor-like protein [Myxococcales bacterium]|jgi:Raf kinase inhibitor-like YbhB/YbcL family protein